MLLWVEILEHRVITITDNEKQYLYNHNENCLRFKSTVEPLPYDHPVTSNKHNPFVIAATFSFGLNKLAFIQPPL